MLNKIRASLASFIAPGVSIPFAGTEARQIQLVSPAAPIASAAPGLLPGHPAELDSIVKAVAAFRNASPSARARAIATRPAAAALGRPTRAIAPATDENGTPQKSKTDTSTADTINSVIESLEQTLVLLKQQAGSDDVSADDVSADEAEARSALKDGRKTVALAALNRAITSLDAKVKAKKSLRNSPPDGKARAMGLITSGFNEQPAVAALNSMLHRPAASASLALSAVGGTRTPAQPAATTRRPALPPDGTLYRSLTAQRSALNAKARRAGIYDQAFLAEDSKLKAAINRETLKLRQ